MGWREGIGARGLLVSIRRNSDGRFSRSSHLCCGLGDVIASWIGTSRVRCDVTARLIVGEFPLYPWHSHVLQADEVGHLQVICVLDGLRNICRTI
jgi:hypothetical protein